MKNPKIAKSRKPKREVISAYVPVAVKATIQRQARAAERTVSFVAGRIIEDAVKKEVA